MSTQEKHTPGPWHFEKERLEGTFHVAGRGPRVVGNKQQIALVCSGYASAHRLEAEANAYLIAAAPELLEALQEAKRTIHALHGDIAWEIYDRSSPEMKQINSAIAKATGVAA